MSVHKLEKKWSQKHNWGSTRKTALKETPFDEGDVVVSPDIQERLNPGYVVSKIYLDEYESIHQKGIFWDQDIAYLFAVILDRNLSEYLYKVILNE